jgi:alpha-glutamyl/putrescinyl thymine pyrophosphorylase clade 1
MPKPLMVGGVKLRPTPVYDAYWRFADERQRAYYRKKRGDLILTADPIIATFRFTNAYRAIDRVSQYLVSHVIPKSRRDSRDLFFRILLFKIFNKIETWELLESALGEAHADDFDWDSADRELARALTAGDKIYSAAYIMPSPAMGRRLKHSNHLLLLRHLMRRRISAAWIDARSLSALYRELLSVPSFGRFLAFQYAIDLNYADVTRFDEDSFVVAGPGAIDGISKCFENADVVQPETTIAAVVERQEEEFGRLGLQFPGLYGRPLKRIDCQNLFCEVSKYSRVSHPHVPGVAKRTNVKQTYKPKCVALGDPQFPQSWGICPARVYEDAVAPALPM